MKANKTVLIGVSGGIAAYKSAYVISGLKKKGYDVHVIMTKHATEFISPLTFETLSGNRCTVDMFERSFEYDVKHVSLAKAADTVLIAPATANTIAKLAHGMADDMLATTVLACTCPRLIAPAMNSAMYENPATQDNIDRLRKYGFEIIEPGEGRLACGDTGPGRMAEPDELIAYVEHFASSRRDMSGLKVLVTAGPTQEAIDPVRYITNHSSGRMGYALARAAARRGANVTLVSGRTELKPEPFVENVQAVSAQDMFEAVTSRADGMDIVVMAAAVADFRPAEAAAEKIKKPVRGRCGAGAGQGEDSSFSLALAPTRDILAYLGSHKKEGQFLCGFAMETENLIENATSKLQRKNLDMICANNLRTEGAGFGCDTNVLTLITPDSRKDLSEMTKDEAADEIFDEILANFHRDRTTLL